MTEAILTRLEAARHAMRQMESASRETGHWATGRVSQTYREVAETAEAAADLIRELSAPDGDTGSAAPAEHRAELNPNPTIGYPEWRLVPTEPSPEMIEAARLPILCRRDCNVSKATAKDVYRAMLKASPAPEKAPGEWRSFDTAPLHERVLVFRPDAGVFTASYCASASEDDIWPDRTGEPCWFADDGDDLTGDLPTHWMPLPPAPPALPGGEGNQTLTSARDQPQPDPIKGRSDMPSPAGGAG